jgi:LPS-assembly lipoprotein
MTPRLTAIALAAALLAGCGFQLRNALTLPQDLGPVRVVATDPYSVLAESLADGLQRAGAQAAPADTATPAATLQVLSEQWADTPISHDEFGRAQEFTLRYAVVFSMRHADDGVVVPQQAVELARDYLAPAVDSIGKASERELLVRELRRDMVAAILRRVDAASKPVASAQ